MSQPSGLDHIVLATPHLDDTVSRFEQLTGVAPVLGGDHAKIGSRNYLVRFNDHSYFEIIGRNPDASVDAAILPFQIGTLTLPTIATWAFRTSEITQVAARAKRLGFDFGVVDTMSRRPPDGQVLSWTLTPFRPEESGVVPFLIDWGSGLHPAQTIGPQLDLLDMTAFHPQPSDIKDILASLDAGLDLQQGPVEIRLRLNTPRGIIDLDLEAVAQL